MFWFLTEIETRCRVTVPSFEIIVDNLQEALQDPKTPGLAFINVTGARSGNDDEPFAIVSEQKEHLTGFVEELALTMGLEYPQLIAFTPTRTIERTILRSLISGSPDEARTARLLLRCLQNA
jgi:hypothetical protein